MYYSTVTEGRTHIAFNEHYLGSVNTYSNFISKGIMRLFKKTIDVSIDGEMRCFEKADYARFANKLGLHQTIESIQSLTVLENLPKTPYHTERGFGLMRLHLPLYTQVSLGRRLMRAIWQQDFHTAKKLVGKGAALDTGYTHVQNGRFSMYHYLGQAKMTATHYAEYKRVPADLLDFIFKCGGQKRADTPVLGFTD